MAHAAVAAALVLLLRLHVFVAPAEAAEMAVLSQGQSLGPNDTLVSNNSAFVLGFFALRGTGGEPDRRYLGVWYKQAAELTVPWVANRDAHVNASASAYYATVTASGELQVVQGDRVKWRTNTSLTSSSPPGNVTLVLLDNGNLELSVGDGGTQRQVLWQSFHHPTDTFLPGMRIKLDRRGGEVRQTLFTSWRNPGDPAIGNFTLGLDPHGSGQLYIWKSRNGTNSSTYWRSGQWANSHFIGVPWPPLNVYGLKLNVPSPDFMYLTFNTFNNTLLRFMLDANGTETCYMLNNSTGEWGIVGSQPTIPCHRYNWCGVNAECAAGDNGQAVCNCLKGFEPRSAAEYGNGNWTRGCVRSVPLTCELNVTGGDNFADLPGVKLPDFATWESMVRDENSCKQLCLANCSCGAYSYDSSDTGCLTWGQDLLDISEIQDGKDYVLHIKVPAASLWPILEKHHPLWRIFAIISAMVFFISVACLLLWWKRGRNIKGSILQLPYDVLHGSWRSRYSSSRTQQKSAMLDLSESIRFDDDMENGKSYELKIYTLDLIKAATCNFSDSNRLGAGGFGPVFMGKLTGGEEVAVKRLCRNSSQGLEEFKNEVILIAKLQHRNLVRLLGCCIEGEEKILVYEYMPNKSLDAFLFDPDKQILLDWTKRFYVIEGIARGLLYLHRDSRLRVLHRDLKASNILLDASMDPKISDFGIARIFGGDENQLNTDRVVGTLGYMPPEYALEGIFSIKSDVYSFGVLVLEIITGRRAGSFHGHQNSLNIAGYAWRQWNEDKSIELIEPSIRESCSMHQILRCIHIALLCVQDHPNDRPDIPTVIRMLSSDNLNLRNPKPPTLMLLGPDTEASKSSENEQTYSVGTVRKFSEFFRTFR